MSRLPNPCLPDGQETPVLVHITKQTAMGVTTSIFPVVTWTLGLLQEHLCGLALHYLGKMVHGFAIAVESSQFPVRLQQGMDLGTLICLVGC